MNIKKKILVTTPTYTGGSWVCVENLLPFLSDNFQIVATGLGRPRKLPNVKYFALNYFSFEKINPKKGRNVFYNFLYQVPLQLINAVSLLLYRPNMILSNGFTPVILLLPFIILFKIPVTVYYGSYLTDWFRHNYFKQTVKWGAKHITQIFVNSEGSKEDLMQVTDQNKILVIDHWTDNVTVDETTRQQYREELNFNKEYLNLLFVGRFIKEKGVEILIDVIKTFQSTDKVKFWFAGDGILADKINLLEKTNPNVHILGFIHDRDQLKKVITAADLLWGFADETYLAVPAVEALSLGTPIIVPNIAGVTEKYNEKVKIRSSLVPKEIGWLVEVDQPSSIRDILIEIGNNKTNLSEYRINSKKYADQKYSSKNIKGAVDIIEKILS